MALYKTGAPIADNLTTEDANTALSAKQGKVLKDIIDNEFPDYANAINLYNSTTDIDSQVFTIASDGYLLVSASTKATVSGVVIRVVINGAGVFERELDKRNYQPLFTSMFKVKKGDIAKITAKTSTSDGEKRVRLFPFRSN